MKLFSRSAVWCSCCLAALVLAACSRHTAAALDSSKIPEAIQHAFRQSTGEAKEVATQVVTACQNQDFTAVFTNLQLLTQRTDLTAEQRSVAARAMVATMPKLQATAATGDANAQATLHQYISNR